MNSIKRQLRILKWQRSYRNVTKDVPKNPRSRALKHIEMLDIYWARVFGFCRLDPNTFHWIENDLLLVIVAATRVAAKDFTRLTPDEQNAILPLWNEYRNSLSVLESTENNFCTAAEKTYIKFQAVADVFPHMKL